MMVLSALRQDASLPEFLAHRARSASVRRLTVDAIAGVAIVSSGLRWMPSAWLFLAGAGLALASYGVWGVSDRARSHALATQRDSFRKVMSGLCALMAAFGAIALAALLYSAWALALGTWIS